MRCLLVKRQLADLQRWTGHGNRLAKLEFELLAHFAQLGDQILPLAHAQPTQVLGLADAAQRGIARLAIRLEHAVPQVQRGQEITGRVRIPVVDPIRLLTVLVGTFARILQAQERDYYQHRRQSVRRGRLRGFDDHTAQTHVDRNTCQQTAGMRQHHLAMFARHGLQLGQLVETIRHGLHIRRIDETEIRHILRRTRHTHRQHVQHDRAQGRAQNLRLREFGTRLEILTRIQADRNAVGDTAATARTLVRARLADRLDRQTLHLRRLRIAGDTRRARIDHISDARHRQRRFGDIRGDHNTLMRMRFEHLMLFLRRQPCEQRHDLDRIRPAHIRRARTVMAAQRVLEIVDVALAGSEHENVARTTVVRGMDHQFGAGARHRGGHVHVRVARIAAVPAIRRGRQRLVIRVAGHRARFETRHGTHQRRRGAQRLIHDLHRIRASRHFDDRHLRVQRVFEMLLELHRIDCRGRDDELQVAPLGQQRRQIAEQEIDVQTALMRLVDDDRVVLHELRIALDLCQQNTVRHHAQARLRRAFVREPHLIADFLTQRHAHFAGDSFGDGTCGKPARLRVHDLPAVRSTAQFQQNLRQLRGFAGARLAGNDHHLARLDGFGDVAASRGNRQFGRIFEFHAFTTSMTRKPFELAYLPTSNPSPNCVASHGISESEPRFLCTTR